MLEETLTLFKVVSQSFKNKTGPSLTADVVLPLISTFSNDIVVFALFTFILEFFPTYFKFFRVKLDFLLSTNLNLESFSFIKLFPPPSISITLVPTVISFPEISMSFAKYILVFVGSAVISYYHCTGNKGGNCKSDYINETKIDKAISEVLKLIIIPQHIRENISNSLKIVHAKKNGYSKEVKAKIQKQIITLENRIEKAFLEKLDGNIPHDFWKANNDKWQAEKDKLYIQLEEINKLDKRFYEQSDSLLSFTDNAYDYYLKGNNEQKRRIIEIISDKISYKDKNFDIELKPVFQTIAENQYKLRTENNNNRTLETSTKKGLETNSCPNNRKNSPGWTRTSNPSINSRMLRH